MINVTINGRSYSAEENTTILDIARGNHIDIPTLCYLEGVRIRLREVVAFCVVPGYEVIAEVLCC